MKQTILILLALSLFSACGTKNDSPALVGEEIIWTSGDKPEWVYQAQADLQAERKYRGESYYHATERSAKESAFSNALASVVKHSGILVTSSSEQVITGGGKESGIQTLNLRINKKEKLESVGLINALQTVDTYVEQWARGERSYFRAYVLVLVNSDDNERFTTLD